MDDVQQDLLLVVIRGYLAEHRLTWFAGQQRVMDGLQNVGLS
jgi:hypothetical protein